MEKFDLIVIGAGPGGYPAAIRAAQLGASVAIVEREVPGGTCLNWGCIPTKTLIASAEFADQFRHAETLGFKAAAPQIDYPALIRRKNEVVAQLSGGVAGLLKANGVKWFHGTASFLTRNQINVANGSINTVLEAAHTIIATGSTSTMPGFLPHHSRVVESRSFLDLTRLPASVIILGGGVIGCEFACLLARLGVQVTLVEMLSDILLILDEDVRRELRQSFEKKLKIRILTGAPLTDITANDNGVSGKAGDQTVSAELMLVSIGRRPVTAELNLAGIGIQTTPAGHIPIDAQGRTRAATVFAVGDVNGGPQFAHAATRQGVIIAENLYAKSRTTFDPLVPACIFTDPEVGSVGLTEAQAKEQNRAVKIGKFSFAHLGKALASGHPGGFVKWIADATTDRLLGAQAVGSHATELIAEATLAIRGEYTAQELGRAIHSHPTLSEAWMEAAHALHGTCIHAPPRRKT